MTDRQTNKLTDKQTNRRESAPKVLDEIKRKILIIHVLHTYIHTVLHSFPIYLKIPFSCLPVFSLPTSHSLSLSSQFIITICHLFCLVILINFSSKYKILEFTNNTPSPPILRVSPKDMAMQNHML